MSAPSKSEIAVAHVLCAIRDDGRKAYLLGLGTQSFAALTDAYAETHGLDAETFRADFWSRCRPERVIVAEDDQ